MHIHPGATVAFVGLLLVAATAAAQQPGPPLTDEQILALDKTVQH